MLSERTVQYDQKNMMTLIVTITPPFFFFLPHHPQTLSMLFDGIIAEVVKEVRGSF